VQRIKEANEPLKAQVPKKGRGKGRGTGKRGIGKMNLVLDQRKVCTWIRRRQRRSGESKKAQVRGIKESPADWISAGLFANVESFDVSLACRPIVPR